MLMPASGNMRADRPGSRPCQSGVSPASWAKKSRRRISAATSWPWSVSASPVSSFQVIVTSASVSAFVVGRAGATLVLLIVSSLHRGQGRMGHSPGRCQPAPGVLFLPLELALRRFFHGVHDAFVDLAHELS